MSLPPGEWYVIIIGRMALLILGWLALPHADAAASSANAPPVFASALAAKHGGPPDLDRVAYMVEGAESDHGRNAAMWRSNPDGPQGPMQVSRSAAMDVGDGDRFDLIINRALGRAYLRLMYRRYGNWPDAVAAYNWGPANLDTWIGTGRVTSQVPIRIRAYVRRVLRVDLALSDESHTAGVLRDSFRQHGDTMVQKKRVNASGPYVLTGSAPGYHDWRTGSLDRNLLADRSLGASALTYRGW